MTKKPSMEYSTTKSKGWESLRNRWKHLLSATESEGEPTKSDHPFVGFISPTTVCLFSSPIDYESKRFFRPPIPFTVSAKLRTRGPHPNFSLRRITIVEARSSHRVRRHLSTTRCFGPQLSCHTGTAVRDTSCIIICSRTPPWESYTPCSMRF
jgi:hypothetical protein